MSDLPAIIAPPLRGWGSGAAATGAAPAVELHAMAHDPKPRGGGMRRRSHAPPRNVEHAPARHAGEVVVRGEIAVEAEPGRLRALPHQTLRGETPEIAVDGAQAHPGQPPPDLSV